MSAALPPVLVGLGIATVTASLLAFGRPPHVLGARWPGVPHTFALVAGLVFLAVLVLGAALAATHRLPLWVYPWMGADVVGLVVALNLVIEDREFAYSPVADVVVLLLFFVAGAAVLVHATWQGWRPAGLLSAGLCATLGLSFCFWVGASPASPELGLIAGPLGLVVGALLYVYARASRAVAIAALAAIALVNGGIAWAVELAFRASALSAPPTSMLGALLLFSTGPLLVGPLLGMLAGRLRRLLSRRAAGGLG
jgi:hypothetical protein